MSEPESTVLQADWEEDELIFTVHLEEEESPENLQWDIRKTYMDVIHFRNRWQVKGKGKDMFCPITHYWSEQTVCFSWTNTEPFCYVSEKPHCAYLDCCFWLCVVCFGQTELHQ